MDSKQLRERTKQLALRVVNLASSLPANRLGDVLGRQILKSGTSIGANYREALRASSRKQFIWTLEIALREADETLYWLELLAESQVVKPSRLISLIDETSQIIGILAATIRTAKRRSSVSTTAPPPKSEI